jgi:hypothetical protein
MEALESVEKFNQGKDSTDLVFEKAVQVLDLYFLSPKGLYQKFILPTYNVLFLSRCCMVEKME